MAQSADPFPFADEAVDLQTGRTKGRDDITRKPDEFPSPAWHKEVLEECRRRAESGEEQFSDWETAKDEIRRRVR